MKKALTEMLDKHFEGKEFNEQEAKELVKKAVTSAAATSQAPTEAAPAPQGKIEAAPPAAAPAPAVPVAATNTPAPAAEIKAESKLANGLFQGFTLGSTLKQGPTGNVMSNMKAPQMDYEKRYQQSTKNVKMTPEEASQIKPTQPQKKS